jgi:hypothetical protein
LDSNIKQTDERLKGYHEQGQVAVAQVADADSVNDLLSRARMGWRANDFQTAARVLNGLGVSDDNIQTLLHTNPAAGDELTKLFLQFSAGAVRQMGAREPGSVISLFAKAYPNLETVPNAAELMTNALRMRAQWQQDRADAAEKWNVEQQKGMGPFGQNYQGMNLFEKQFSQSNNPRDYWKAAQAFSIGDKAEAQKAWQGMSEAEQHRVFALIPPGRKFVGGDGKIYQKPVQ